MPLSSFHPTIARWFRERLGVPTAPQREGWPLIRSGEHVLIAAPTGSGKTLAAFLSAIDGLISRGSELRDETSVLYISPLKALGNDVQKNLAGPLSELRALDPTLPEVRVLVRSGDTPQKERAAMTRRPPHILVTTPESLYILLTSAGGRALLASVRTVIVDEIHAVLGDKRGSHLALSLERLGALVERAGGREPQRIGLSATQKPPDAVADFLGGVGRAVRVVDAGSFRALDLAIELPPSPLEPVCSHETWGEIYKRVSELVLEHRTTLVFVQTRKLAERVAAQLAALLGEARVTCHHSSLAKERRLAAEERLKQGQLSALVATASLELGIDIGDVDLVCQLGTPRSIAMLLQRVGRAGHGVGRVPKGRLFPLTPDELVEAAALLRALKNGVLDRTPTPRPALDVLAQQMVAECASEPWSADELFSRFRRAWPYRSIERADFDSLVTLHAQGRAALLHVDGVNGVLRGTRRARLTAITCGGAIPDSTQYQVVLEPEGTPIGSIDEDYAIESNAGDVFQLGNASWRILRVQQGVVRVVDARGAPPSLPFWFGEAPARTRELSDEVSAVREHGSDAAWVERETGIGAAAARELASYLTDARAALGAMPTSSCLVLERFFDESGGSQLVLHSPLGSRINRALGLVLRKRFCRHFGFELQAAASSDHVLISLSPQHSFPLEEVFDYVRSSVARDLLVQAVLVTPLFESRWRRNVTRSLLVERFQSGKRVPPPLLRMRADDALARAFPDVVACGETLPPGDIAIPWGHPLVRQTLADCLEEAMDAEGMVATLRALEEDAIERVAIDTVQPSPFARAALSTMPYGFLDDAPLEERRTQAVLSRRVLDARTAETLGALDPAAIEAVQAEAWPDPRNIEEVHEALSWMGYVTSDEAGAWQAWLAELERAGRVVRVDERWFAVEATREPKAVLRGRMEALGPVVSDDPLLFELERDGVVLRIPHRGTTGWCERRLLARIQRRTLDTLRREIEPVPTAEFLRFLAAWQRVDPDFRGEGPAGLKSAIERLAGFEAPAKLWERELLAARVQRYRPEWLDQLALSGEIAWGRLFGSGNAPLRTAPIAFFPRSETDSWLALAAPVDSSELSWPARGVLDALTARGALFTDDLARATKLLPTDLERGLGELVARGLVTSDSFASLRAFLLPAYRRKSPIAATGRWSLFRSATSANGSAPSGITGGASTTLGATGGASTALGEFAARALLRRYGVLFRALLERERLPIPWRDLARSCRTLELRGELRGGRFVAGFAGEQFALPEAVTLLRSMKKRPPSVLPELSSADPLALEGSLIPGQRGVLAPARPGA